MNSTRFGFARGLGFADLAGFARPFDLEITGFFVTVFFTFFRADDLPLFACLVAGVALAEKERTLADYVQTQLILYRRHIDQYAGNSKANIRSLSKHQTSSPFPDCFSVIGDVGCGVGFFCFGVVAINNGAKSSSNAPPSSTVLMASKMLMESEQNFSAPTVRHKLAICLMWPWSSVPAYCFNADWRMG